MSYMLCLLLVVYLCNMWYACHFGMPVICGMAMLVQGMLVSRTVYLFIHGVLVLCVVCCHIGHAYVIQGMLVSEVVCVFVIRGMVLLPMIK